MNVDHELRKGGSATNHGLEASQVSSRARRRVSRRKAAEKLRWKPTDIVTWYERSPRYHREVRLAAEDSRWLPADARVAALGRAAAAVALGREWRQRPVHAEELAIVLVAADAPGTTAVRALQGGARGLFDDIVAGQLGSAAEGFAHSYCCDDPWWILSLATLNFIEHGHCPNWRGTSIQVGFEALPHISADRPGELPEDVAWLAPSFVDSVVSLIRPDNVALIVVVAALWQSFAVAFASPSEDELGDLIRAADMPCAGALDPRVREFVAKASTACSYVELADYAVGARHTRVLQLLIYFAPPTLKPFLQRWLDGLPPAHVF